MTKKNDLRPIRTRRTPAFIISHGHALRDGDGDPAPANLFTEHSFDHGGPANPIEKPKLLLNRYNRSARGSVKDGIIVK
jgi:hypothetical protein